MGLLAFILAIVGSFTLVLGPPLIGFLLLITALFFGWAGKVRQMTRKDRS